MIPFSRQEIATIFKTARRVLKHPGLDILTAPRCGSYARLLVVTPRRCGNAPQRNRVRRRLKALFYENHYADQEFDCIIIIKQPHLALSFDQLKTILHDALAKARSYL